MCLQVTVLNKIQPDEFYNLAAQSHVQVSRVSEEGIGAYCEGTREAARACGSSLAADSIFWVQISFELPVYTAQVDGVGTLNALEAVRQAGLAGKTKFYQVAPVHDGDRFVDPSRESTTA